MTSEVGDKTNEFLRRRKLRIQQVREQSKHVAKKIRQRTNVEKHKHLVSLDAEKEKEYLEQQDKFVKKLQQLYVKGLDKVGTSHRSAAEVVAQVAEGKNKKSDLAKERGRAAAAELRRQKQTKLDQKKKSLDRKLHAREAANEISREKSSSVALRDLEPAVVQSTNEKDTENLTDKQTEPLDNCSNEKDKPQITRSEMATQWSYEELPNEWVPHVPQLSLSKEDSGIQSPKSAASKIEKVRKPNLFAISDEMPSSLRGGFSGAPEEIAFMKPSLTLVSDHIQNRDLRLRDYPSLSKKEHIEDLQSIKQTILRTRASRIEVSARGSSNLEKPTKITANDVPLTKKNSITMYNHSTRDTREVPYGSKKVVIRDEIAEEDAYSQAVKKNSIDLIHKEKEQGKKMHDVRNRIAVSKQKVEKEYQDTMAFLSCMPKDKSRPVRHAYKDAYQQQAHKECRQRKMQQEFKKIQRESEKQSHVSFGSRGSRFTPKDDSDDDLLDKELKYSWMPVPESDGNLAVHNIPNTVKEPRSANGVRFGKIDSYHEYRSRHKHTPPTKDVPDDDEENIDTAIAEESYESSTSTTSDPDSIMNLSINTESRRKSRPSKTDISDSERIIIYKVLDSKADKKAAKLKKNTKLLKSIVRSLNFIDKGQSAEGHPDEISVNTLKDITENDHTRSKSEANKTSFEFIQEGIYKTVNDKGDNVNPVYHPEELSKNTEISSNKVDKSSSNFNRNVSFGSMKHPIKTNATQAALPSVQTSTSSFQTALNDKKTSYPMHDKATGGDPSAKIENEGGCIKIIDDKGEESGKFYIGASGFLSDDAYELIIQLRKKDDNKVNESVVLKQGDDIEPRSSTAKKLITEITEEALKQNIPCDENKAAKSLPETNIQSNQETTSNTDKQTPESEKPSSVESDNTKDLKSEERKFVEKGVSMTSVESLQMKRSVSPGKSAHTVCTQTQTTASPPDRHAYNRLSSSTSTAYLSPPELIMPLFVKRPCPKNEPSFTRDFRTKPEHLKKINEKKSTNIAKQFTLFKKYVLAQPKIPIIKQFTKVLKAPPNSVRTCSSVCIHEGQVCKKKPKICNTKHCSKNQKGKSNGKQKSKIKLNPKTKTVKQSKSELNPVVKHYVDKLLAMSRDGHAVVDVFKQDCSDVTTPGSSIIDVPHNVIGDIPKADPKISLQQIKNMLIKQILIEFQKSTVPLPKNKNIRCAKKKTVHKVKSLKISRDLSSNKPNKREFSSSDDRQDFIRSISIQPRKLKKTRSKSSPSPRNNYRNVTFKSISSDFLYNMQRKKKYPSRDISRPDTGNRSVNSETPYTAKCVPPHLKIFHNVGPRIDIWKNPKLGSPRETDQCMAGKQKNNQSPKSQEPVREQIKDEITFWSHIRSRILKEQGQNINVMLPDYSSQKPNLPALRPIPQTPENIPQKNDQLPSPQISINLQGQSEKSLKQQTRTSEHASLLQEKCLKVSHQSPETLHSETSRTPHLQESKISESKQDPMVSSNSITNIHKTSQICGTQYDSHYVPLNISTQTCNMGEEITYLKLAEDKLQNMEKIADLTEQCTQRLSNLAKVLDEVRKNKLPTSRISDSGSELDSPRASVDTSYTQVITPVHDIENKRDKIKLPLNPEDLERDLLDRSSNPQSKANKSKSPKAAISSKLSSSQKRTPKSEKELRASSTSSSSTDSVKSREKRSPASRRCLKRATDFIAAHELSTVLEVDSPLSLNYKINCEDVEYQHQHSNGSDTENKQSGSCKIEDKRNNPDLLPSSENVASNKNSTSDSSDEFKMQMMDLKQFNEIMLKPFISIQDYAKQCNLETLEEGSNVEISKLPRDEAINDDISSLHSDGSLPDVIAELLKRKIINEPFKYDTVNSSTVTSESTMSVLALSKVKKDKRKTKNTFSNKENIEESSDTQSFSTNPDLENAFQKLGMGWASSTLKKTKERLALSSSSNSSSSSAVPFKKHGFPILATDSSTTQNASHTTVRVRLNEPHTQVRSNEPRTQECPSEVHSQVRPSEEHSQIRASEAHSQARPSGPYMQVPTITPLGGPATECTKSAGLQTSLTNSMTVQQFLTRELAKKITFTHKSHSYREDLEDEFVSLYDTKIPEALQASPKLKRADRSMDSNARARTSTPVQIYKSITYHTSSSSNMSNGLFSNADLSSVKQTSHSLKNHSTSDDKDDLTVPNFSLRTKKGLSECSKSD